MKTLALAATACAMLAAIALDADAKRARPPRTEICNKTSTKQYVATMSYAGRGQLRTDGWIFIEPGKCSTFFGDRYAVKGSGRLTGAAKRDSQRGCVQNTKVFDITAEGGAIGDEQACKARGGFIVDFEAPRPDTRARTKPLTIEPRARKR